MVGVATKNRCDNCRKRKKKCDEKVPSCSQCLISGWTCPGYSTPWKFVDESQQLAKHYASRKYVYDIIDLDLEAAHRQDSSPDTDFNLDDVWEEIRFPHRTRHNSYTTFMNYVPRYIEPNPLGSSLVFCMGSKVEGTLIPLHLVGSFFDFIPARMGFNIALDDVVSCLCSIYSRKFSTPHGYQKDIYQSYTRALASLRTCLEDPVLRMQSETLCASILLQICELIVNVDRGEWSNLARGTHLLLESRGVERYKTAFDLAMLESQLGFIFSHSVKAHQPCFIHTAEWQSLFPPNPVFPYHTTQPHSLTLRTQCWNILSEVHSLFLEFSALFPTQIDFSTLDHTCRKASTLFATLKAWVENESDTLAPNAWPDVVSGVLDCTASMALLTLSKMLASLERTRSRSSSPESPSSTPEYRPQRIWIEDPVVVEYWTQRALTAFAFVQKESMVASKVLDFGMQQLSLIGGKSKAEEPDGEGNEE